MKKLLIVSTVLFYLAQMTSCVQDNCEVNEDGVEVCEETDTDTQDSGGTTDDSDGSEDDSDDDSGSDSDQDTGDIGDDLPTGQWSEVAEEIADYVDDASSNDELSKYRSPASFSEGDDCHSELNNNTRFADTIAYFVEELSEKQTVQVQGIAPYYNMSSDNSTYEKVSLISHRLCRVTSTTLSDTIKNIPGSSTISLANRFAEEHNQYRTDYLAGDENALVDLKKLWGKFFGCLAYSESLSTADTSSSYNVADDYAPSGYSKPEGVKFYEDPYQDAASRLNIGLFQFTPNYSGNINPCFKQWNNDYPNCSLSSGSQSAMIPIVGSSLQHFNAYCGVHKLLQTFAVQVNSSSAKNTHPDNELSSGLKDSSQRCVTPHFYAGWAYNHFGPLQNSTGSNLYKLMSCVYQD